MPIGRLQRVPLREVWPHEARDFTTWLQDNIDVLNSALDMNLVNIARERPAGSFSIDLVAEDENIGTVVIENQLEKSNHDHLGKVITYLSALSARAAIWIVSDPRPEHVAAITWLNEATSADFYLVKLDAVKIGASDVAPVLTLIVGPTEDYTVKQERGLIAETDQLLKNFWQSLISNPEARLHAHVRPGTRTWISVASEISGISFGYTTTQNTSYVELYIDRGIGAEEENRQIFEQIVAHRQTISESIQGNILEQALDGRRACRIKISIQGGYRSPESEWQSIQNNMISKMNAFHQAVTPILRSIRQRP